MPSLRLKQHWSRPPLLTPTAMVLTDGDHLPLVSRLGQNIRPSAFCRAVFFPSFFSPSLHCPKYSYCTSPPAPSPTAPRRLSNPPRSEAPHRLFATVVGGARVRGRGASCKQISRHAAHAGRAGAHVATCQAQRLEAGVASGDAATASLAPGLHFRPLLCCRALRGMCMGRGGWGAFPEMLRAAAEDVYTISRGILSLLFLKNFFALNNNESSIFLY